MAKVKSEIDKSELTESDLSRAFVEYATAHHRFYISSDTKASNRAHDKLIGIAIKFRQLEDRGEHMLRELVSSEQESVKSWAAYFLLNLDERLAVKTLQDIIKTTQSASLTVSCRVTLEEWRAGRLDVNWYIKKK